ncbi:MAG TPA: hypothetical protein VJG30_02175 [Candidatus Nanoarchaeia archaeon]|nr:hypothetical protein [Candidatus Nanoarchaeia archaeon]
MNRKIPPGQHLTHVSMFIHKDPAMAAIEEGRGLDTVAFNELERIAHQAYEGRESKPYRDYLDTEPVYQAAFKEAYTHPDNERIGRFDLCARDLKLRIPRIAKNPAIKFNLMLKIMMDEALLKLRTLRGRQGLIIDDVAEVLRAYQEAGRYYVQNVQNDAANAQIYQAYVPLKRTADLLGRIQRDTRELLPKTR